MPPPLQMKEKNVPDDQELIPIEQDTIDFEGYPVIGIRLLDGRIGASLRDLCDAMKIDRYSQMQRIRGDETIAHSLISVRVQTRGGFQNIDFLIAWAIPYWLTGIELSRIKDEQKRQSILLFKRRAADVLYQHFSERKASSEPSNIVVPTEQMTRPLAPAQDASAFVWAEYHQQMAAFYQWKASTDTRIDALEERQGEMESRLDEQRRVLAFIPEILERLGPQTLTPQHYRQVQTLAKQLHQATNKPYARIYDDLKTAFEKPRIEDLLEDDWTQIEQWFRRQLERGKQR